MSKLFGQLKISGEKLETPFLVSQTQGHLVFGPLSRHFPAVYLAIAAGVTALVSGLIFYRGSSLQYLGSLVDKLVFLVIFILLGTQFTKLQQAIVGWITVKATLGMIAFMMLFVGATVSFAKGRADAWSNLFLGLVWLPGIEFIPSLQRHQKIITIARLILSIPIIYFGVMSGEWHWG